MKTHEILNLLKRHKPILTQRFDLVDLALFGSSARGESGSAAISTSWSPSRNLPPRNAISAYSFIWRICSGVRWIW
uniref:Nucleotidyltransferase domain-containing protein n=1 Tax=Candidatus Kentrum sp. SD TaxID=2126332 RepID=A0A450YGF9_9GAMM|nr:MAG: hypothetical protein BECKSD772F_GA0070984_106223 [Candidatus Kentron sp. SD]VFK46078.1 MAG: hypothetical protein BECKSD772E_GA0070983_106622 [Candidatus Kentron sp. SD]